MIANSAGSHKREEEGIASKYAAQEDGSVVCSDGAGDAKKSPRLL